MSYFFKHFDVTEDIRAGGNCKDELCHITESEFTESIKLQEVASIEAIKVYDNFGIHYSVRVSLQSLNDKPNIYFLTNNSHHVLFYKSMGSMLNALRNFGYHLQRRDLNIISYFSGI